MKKSEIESLFVVTTANLFHVFVQRFRATRENVDRISNENKKLKSWGE